MNESTLVKVTLELPAEVVAYFDDLSESFHSLTPEKMMADLLCDAHAQFISSEESV